MGEANVARRILGDPSSRSPGAKPMMGGSVPSALKKLKGATLTEPFSSNVVTHAIGRGVMSEASMAYARLACLPSKSTSIRINTRPRNFGNRDIKAGRLKLAFGS